MTDSFVTQCPHCHTSFRVSHGQLSVARGVVRCGSCLQVFNAARQLLEQRAVKDVAAPPVSPAKPAVEAPRAISQKQWTAAELDLDDLDKELARLERRDKRAPDTFGRRREDNLSAQREHLSSEQEPWSDSLYSESPPNAPKPPSSRPSSRSSPMNPRDRRGPNHPCRWRSSRWNRTTNLSPR